MATCAERLLEQYPHLDKNQAERLATFMTELQSTVNTKGKSLSEIRQEGVSAVKKYYENSLQNEVQDAQKMITLLNHIAQKGFQGNMAEAILSVIEGTTRNVKNKTFNLEGVQLAKRNLLTKWLASEMESKGLISKSGTILDDPDFQRKLFSEVLDSHKEGFVRSSDPKVREAASIIKRLNNKLIELQRGAGSTISARPDYLFAQSHDADKIFADPRKWAEFTVDKVEPFIGKAREQMIEELEKIGRDMTITAGESVSITFGHRNLQFKSGSDFYDYNAEYGRGGLLDGLDSSISLATRKYAVQEVLGSSPQKQISKLVKYAQSTGMATSKEFGASAIEQKATDAMKVFLGHGNRPGTGYGQKLFNGIQIAKQGSALWYLGGSAFSAIKDISNHLMTMKTYHGTNIFEGTWQSVGNWLSGFSNDEAKRIAEIMQVSMPDLFTDFYDGLGNIQKPGSLSKAVNYYMMVNLTTKVTRMNRVATVKTHGYALAKQLMEPKSNWLGEQTFGAIGLDARDQASLRAILTNSKEKFISPQSVRLNRELLADPSDGYVNQLESKLGAFFNHVANTGSPVATNKQKRVMGRHLRQDSVARSAMEALFFLRSTLLKSGYVTTEMMRAADPSGTLGNWNSVKAIAQFGMAAAVTTYVADSLRDFARGREVELTPKKIMDGFINSGAAGIFADLTIGDYYKYRQSTWESAAGPLLSPVGKAVAGGAKLIREGDTKPIEHFFKDLDKKPAKVLGRWNLWYWQAIQAHILNESNLNTPRKGGGRQ